MNEEMLPVGAFAWTLAFVCTVIFWCMARGESGLWGFLFGGVKRIILLLLIALSISLVLGTLGIGLK